MEKKEKAKGNTNKKEPIYTPKRDYQRNEIVQQIIEKRQKYKIPRHVHKN